MISRRSIAVLGVAAVLGATGLVLRVRQVPHLSENPEPRRVGAFHAHSEDSHDSRLTQETLAEAARKRGLDFLIITDHNKQRAAASALHGVTLLSYAELSTAFGHVVQLGATYTLDKQQRNDPGVLYGIGKAGGFPVVTHPSDVKRPWTGSYDGVGGLEIANMSSAARRFGGPLMFGLIPLAAAWPWHKSLAFAQLYDRDAQALATWDALPPHVISLCGSDTHGWIDPAINLGAWSMVMDVAVDSTAHNILQAVRDGHFHCSAGLVGHDPVFSWQAQSRSGATDDLLPPASVSAARIASLTLTGPTEPAGDVELVIVQDGRVFRRGPPPQLRVSDPPPGVYRAEVRVRMPRLLWGSVSVPVVYGQRLTLTAAPP